MRHVVVAYSIFLVIRLLQAGFDLIYSAPVGFTSFILQLVYTIVFLVISLLEILISKNEKEIRNLLNQIIEIVTDLQGMTFNFKTSM